MPNRSTSRSDEVPQPAETINNSLYATHATTPVPVVHVGVNRKVNIGNFENVDVYVGLSLPMPDTSIEDMDNLTDIIEATADDGIKIAAAETYKRYTSIKELISGQSSD